MVEIDGTHGEGGGQILRTALSLSCLYQKPFRISNIRKRRKKQGLMPQHLTAVRAAQLLTAAEVAGDSTGSTELSFNPRGMKEGDLVLDIGTAGSTPLLLQTLIPAIAFGRETRTVRLKGGTHVPFSPSFDYLRGIFTPLLLKVGVHVEMEATYYGFYPRGGGTIVARIFPAKQVKPLRVVERGRITELTGCSAVGNLPLSIAERQRSAALAHITALPHLPTPTIELRNVPTPGQGTFLFLRVKTDNSLAGFTALGARGKRAEVVGEEAAKELIDFCSSGASVDKYLADQIVLYLALCDDESEFVVAGVTQHLLTNLWTIGQFREFSYRVDGEVGDVGHVSINTRPFVFQAEKERSS